ncbi:MAG TPA: hypothetical protein VFG95_01655 [Nitrospiria bacterium]|nr:hypothetical protein [Nitrospiria bacterium]
MNGPLFAAFAIAVGAVWLILMLLPGIGHPPVSGDKKDKEETSPDKNEGNPTS